MESRNTVRVLHIIDGLAGGGSERWVYDIARLSDGARIRHRVVTVHPDLGRFVYAERLSALGAYRGAPRRTDGTTAVNTLFSQTTRSVNRGPLGRALRLAWHGGAVFPSGLYRALREWRTFRPHVVHGHTFHGFVFALMLARLARLPLVHTVPCLVSQMKDAGYGWMPPLYARVHPRVARFFTAYPMELRELGVEPERIREISGVVDMSRIEDIYRERARHRLEVRQSLGIAPDAPVALSVGRLHRSKGHELAARAMASASRRFPDLHWLVLGDGTERVSLEATVREVGMTGRAHLLGFVPEVLPYYAAANVYLRTTLLEAENQSSYQAMGMGLPVVGFATGAGTELLGRVGHGVMVPVGDATLLGEAVADVLLAADRGADLGRRGRAYAREVLGIDRTIEQLSATYEELARRDPQAGGA
jgi:glycosyltransferase involved in cell wall biosynthesis